MDTENTHTADEQYHFSLAFEKIVMERKHDRDNNVYAIVPEGSMPCFGCEAFNDDELCLANRLSKDGMDCPRLKELIGSTPAFLTDLAEGTTYADYRELMRNHELDDILAVAKKSVEAFIETHPTSCIDQVRLILHKTDPIEEVEKIVMERKHDRDND